MSRWRLGALLALASFAVALPARADETFGLSFAIAEEEKKPVQTEAWLTDQIASAEKLFGPIGVHFRWTVHKPLASKHARLETRGDRDALTSSPVRVKRRSRRRAFAGTR